jgi:hypothetical protein
MKTIAYFLFLLVFTSVAHANNPFFNQYGSNVTISSLDNGLFLFEINSVNYTPVNNTVYLQGVNQGIDRIVIYKFQPGYYGNGQWIPVFNGNIQIPANANVNARWSAWNGMVVNISPYMQNNYPTNPNYPNYPTNPNYPNNPTNPNYPNNPTNPNYPNNPVIYGMNNNAYSGLLTQLRNASFESNKVSIAKMAIKANGISVNQLQNVLKEFSFDSNRLDVAKFSYPYCVDKNNYFMLNDSFQFSSSASDLMNFIQ